MIKKLFKPDGYKANSFVIPLVIILAILYSGIIVLVYEVNRFSNGLTDMMDQSTQYQSEITDIQVGSSRLVETSMTFILMPLNPDGSLAVGSLSAYASALSEDRRGPQIAERFRERKISNSIQTFIDNASASAVYLMNCQLHAFALIRSVYPFRRSPRSKRSRPSTLCRMNLRCRMKSALKRQKS